MSSISVRVPGSTSNCGAGFDTLGLALGIYNTVTLTPGKEPGPRADRERDARAAGMVTQVVKALEERDVPLPAGFTYRIEGEVPTSRGLGSSVTVLAGVLAGLNHWAGAPLGPKEQVEILTRLEGHPDNAMAGVLGGFCVARCGSTAAELMDVVRQEVPEFLKFVVASPEVEIETMESRSSLPGEIRHGDAVRSINSAAFLTAAMLAGEWDKLQGAAEDFMHEPYRLPGIPGATEALRAGLEAGSLTGWLSGSGSSVLCLAQEPVAGRVAEAMIRGFAEKGIPVAMRVLTADNTGLQVLV